MSHRENRPGPIASMLSNRSDRGVHPESGVVNLHLTGHPPRQEPATTRTGLAAPYDRSLVSRRPTTTWRRKAPPREAPRRRSDFTRHNSGFRDRDEFNEILKRDYAQRYMKLSESAFAAPRVVVRLDPIEPLDRLSASSVDRGLIVRSPRPSRVLYSGRSHWPDTAGTVVSPARVRAVIDRIAADVDQLARARRVEDLDTAAPHRGPAVRPAGGTPSAAGRPGPGVPGLLLPRGIAYLIAPQLERARDAYQGERYRRGKTSQLAGYTDNRFRPR